MGVRGARWQGKRVCWLLFRALGWYRNVLSLTDAVSSVS